MLSPPKSEGFTLDNEQNIIVFSEVYNNSTLLKYSPEGDLLWEFRFDLEDEIFDEFHSISIDEENNIIIVGTNVDVFNLDNYHIESDLIVLKVSEQGDLLWSHVKEGIPDTWNVGEFVVVSGDDVYVMGNCNVLANSTLCLLAFNGEGELSWEKTIESFEGLKITLLGDKLTILGKNAAGFILLNYDLDGNLISSGVVQGGGTYIEPVFDNQGNFYLAKSSGLLGYNLSKYSPTGNFLWKFDMPPELEENVSIYLHDVVRAVEVNEDYILITGGHNSDNLVIDSFPTLDALTVKLDHDGNLEWMNRYEHLGLNSSEIGYDVRQLENGEFIVVGEVDTGIFSAYKDELLLILDENGNTVWAEARDGGYENRNWSLDVLVDGNNFYTLNIVWNEEGDHLTVLRKYAYDMMISQSNATQETSEFKIFPNPANSIVYFNFKRNNNQRLDINIYNTQGVAVLNFQDYKEDYISIPSWIPKGIYFLHFSTVDENRVSRMIIQKS
jgi:hypothetical protein